MKPSTDTPEGYAAPAVIRAFEILKLLALSEAPMSLSDLSRSLDCGKSTMHGLLKALVHVNAVTKTGKSYMVGPTLSALSLKDWNIFKLVRKVSPTLEKLRDRTQETVFLGIPGVRKSTIIATREALKPMKISAPAGTEIPLQAGAVGKIFLAGMTDEAVARFIETYGLPEFTDNAITDPAAYLGEIAAVRDRGYALDNEEYLPGVKAVAAGIQSSRGLPMALWIAGFASAVDDPANPDNITAVIDASLELKAIVDTVA